MHERITIYVEKKRDLEFCTVVKRPLLVKRRNVNDMRLLSREYMDYEVHLNYYGTWYKLRALVGDCPHGYLMSSRRINR